MTATKRIIITIAALVSCCSFAVNAAYGQQYDRKAEKMEARADKAFIRGDHDGAIKQYKRVCEMLNDGMQKYSVELKLARLNILLQRPDEAIRYYGAVQLASDTMLSVNDVCFYLDALRQRDQIQKAEIVARHYAFKNSYARSQRYINALNAISHQQQYYAVGALEYDVRRVGQYTDLPEYWLGKYNGQMFYAASHSRMQDPLKIYYHQTQYFLLNEGGMPEAFRTIPRELQSGPVVFSGDNGMMIATGIDYRSGSHIADITSNDGMFITQIYYSIIDHKNNRWSSFKPLFEFQSGYNYAHPMLFDNDRSLVFSSDRPGGYGGMDLYMSRWDGNANRWGEPVNLGPLVNTEGDEVYPHVFDGLLHFSSNGLEGYGGYDIFCLTFDSEDNSIVPGSLNHFPYPINSVYNDFGVYFDKDDNGAGYFVSDRNGSNAMAKDNLYAFVDRSSSSNAGGMGGSQEMSAMTGNLNDITGMMATNAGTTYKELKTSPMYRSVAEGDVLLSIYFDFNKAALTAESKALLNDLLRDYSHGYVSELVIAGYADDFGGAEYNIRLSSQRADAVANYMQAYDNCPALYIEGRGQLSLTPEELNDALSQLQYNGQYSKEMHTRGGLSMDDRIVLKSKLRRVDIIVAK